MKPTLLVLAAGMGSRYGGLKQLDGIGPNGETIMDYSVHDAIKAGFGKVVFVIRRSFAKEFSEKIGTNFKDKIAVDYVYQEIDSPVEGVLLFPEREKPWGTGHAVLVAATKVKEPFAVINADDYYGPEAFMKIAKFLREDVAPDNYGMVGYNLKNTLSKHGSVSRGVCTTDKEDNLVTVVERTSIRQVENVVFYKDDERNVFVDKNSTVSMNFWGFHPSFFTHLAEHFVGFVQSNFQKNSKAEFYIPLVVNRLVESNQIKLKVLTSKDQWYGVTYQEDREMVQKAFEKLSGVGAYASPLW